MARPNRPIQHKLRTLVRSKFNSDETKHKVETLLRVLGDNGIGGERNAGYGQFEF